MTYGIPALDAVRKFSNEAWLFLAKLLDFLHICMGEDIHKINTNLILLTGPVIFMDLYLSANVSFPRRCLKCGIDHSCKQYIGKFTEHSQTELIFFLEYFFEFNLNLWIIIPNDWNIVKFLIEHYLVSQTFIFFVNFVMENLMLVLPFQSNFVWNIHKKHPRYIFTRASKMRNFGLGHPFYTCIFTIIKNYLRTNKLLTNVAGTQKTITNTSANAKLAMKKFVTVNILGILNTWKVEIIVSKLYLSIFS
jgi:hypothetical protein